MSLPTEGRAGMTTWTEPGKRVPYTVIVADDFGTTALAIDRWEHYKEQLGTVEEVWVRQGGIRGIPFTEHDLATFVALGSTGAALALSGCNCGYGGEGPHGTAQILRDLEVGEPLVPLVFRHSALHFVRLEDRWMVEVEPEE